MGSLRDRLRARTLPTAVVTLQPAQEGDHPEEITLRGLTPDVYEALIEAHPPTDEQRAKGAAYDFRPFRAALLAACVTTPDGEEALTEQDWDELATSGVMAAGEINQLFEAAIYVNNRNPLARVGKG